MHYPYEYSQHQLPEHRTNVASRSRWARKHRASSWTMQDMPPMTRVGKPDLVR